MAGSYNHCEKYRTDEGTTYENDRGETVVNSYGFTFKLIENMGDAHEACEHMYYMIRHLTGGTATIAGNPDKIKNASDAAYKMVYGNSNVADNSSSKLQ